MKFKGKSLTTERLGWWLRIALTRIFGRKVQVMGAEKPLKILPWVWRGEILLMGAEFELLQTDFTSKYTLRLRQSPVVSCDKSPEIVSGVKNAGNRLCPPSQACGIVVLGHQAPEEIKTIIINVKTQSEGAPVLLAYGGKNDDFERIDLLEKVFISCPSLRGPSHMMGHYEMLEAAFNHGKFAAGGVEYVAFIESDLLPLRVGWLDEVLETMHRNNADFGAKEIRDVTFGNCFFHANAVERGVIGPGCGDSVLENRKYLHALGCFYIVRRKFLELMLVECRKMEGLYFEVMFPSAAHAAGGNLLSLGHACEALRDVRFRPFHELAAIKNLLRENGPMAHPVKGETLIEAINLILDR